MNIAPFRKALVPAGVTLVLGALAAFGVGPEVSVEEAVTALLTSGLVWLIPNQA